MLSIEQARSYYTSDDPVHDFDHVLRVLNMARHLASCEGADMEIVQTAALLHDISRLDDDNLKQGFKGDVSAESDHAVQAAQHARRILQLEPSAFVEAVVHAIEAHRFRNNIEPHTIEAKVLFDADKLDAIGAVGIARAFAYAGGHQMPLWARVAEDYRPGETKERHTPVHEFVFKLVQIKDRLYTASGQRIAAERHAFMVEFFRHLDAEVEGRR